MTWYRIMALVITSVGLAGCVLFVVSYWWRTRGAWMREEAGRFLMVVYLNLAALFGLIIVNQVAGNWPGRGVVAITLYTAYAIEAWWPLRLLWQAQRGAHPPPRSWHPARTGEGPSKGQETP